jgi:hypothetical protein
MARWRLHKPDESVGERVVLDMIALEGLHGISPELFGLEDSPRTTSIEQ